MSSVAEFQVFDQDEHLRLNIPEEPFNTQILLPWARRLPTPGRILDLTAGQGIEAHTLRGLGYPTVAADLSFFMLQNAYADRRVLHEVTSLPFAPYSFEGALTKDALVFISPTDRVAMFRGLKRLIRPHGSLLVNSQISTHMKIYYRPKDSNLATSEIVANTQQLFPASKTGHGPWIDQIAQITNAGGHIFMVEYPATPELILGQAQEFGFTPVDMQLYNPHTIDTQSNRWSPLGRFILELKKQ
ncbi:MAG: class I SAM-dependent methyltransferase [Patescibacteria group bacterium]